MLRVACRRSVALEPSARPAILPPMSGPLPHCDPQVQALHQALVAMASEHHEVANIEAGRVRGLLDAGVDPQAVNAQGQTPLGVLAAMITDDNFVHGCSLDLIGHLVNAGANPLTHDQVARQLNRRTLFGSRLILAVEAAEANGRRIFGGDGGCLLHTLAEDTQFCIDAPSTPVRQTWARCVRHSDGATPLHVLWQWFSARPAPHERSMPIGYLLDNTVRWMAWGADPLARDHEGVAAGTLIQQHRHLLDPVFRTTTQGEAGLRAWLAVLGRLDSLELEHRLLRDTAGSGVEARQQQRL